MDPPKRATVDMQLLQGKSQENFVTKHYIILLQKMKSPDGFLQLVAAQCDKKEDFKTAKALVSNLAVTNDHA